MDPTIITDLKLGMHPLSIPEGFGGTKTRVSVKPGLYYFMMTVIVALYAFLDIKKAQKMHSTKESMPL